MAKFTWTEKATEIAVSMYVEKQKEDKVTANSESFLTSIMDAIEEAEKARPVSVRSVRQKLASQKVYVALEESEKPKRETTSKAKKINIVASIAEVIANKTGEDESTVFEVMKSLEGATALCLKNLLSVLTANSLLPPEDDGSKGEQA